MRVTGLVQQGSEGRKVEELLADDRFLDTLADKITHRLTGVGSGLGDTMAGTQASFGGGQSKSQVMGSSLSMAGKPTVMRPDHPSFAEPTDKQSKAQAAVSYLALRAAQRAKVGRQIRQRQP